MNRGRAGGFAGTYPSLLRLEFSSVLLRGSWASPRTQPAEFSKDIRLYIEKASLCMRTTKETQILQLLPGASDWWLSYRILGRPPFSYPCSGIDIPEPETSLSMKWLIDFSVSKTRNVGASSTKKNLGSRKRFKQNHKITTIKYLRAMREEFIILLKAIEKDRNMEVQELGVQK